MPRPGARRADDQRSCRDQRAIRRPRCRTRRASPRRSGSAAAAVLAGINVCAARARAAGAVARCADDDVVVAVAVDVADARRRGGRSRRRCLPPSGLQHATVLARIDVRLAGAGRAGDHVGDAVAGWCRRPLRRRCRGDHRAAVDAPQQLAGLRRVDVDAAGRRAADSLVGADVTMSGTPSRSTSPMTRAIHPN